MSTLQGKINYCQRKLPYIWLLILLLLWSAIVVISVDHTQQKYEILNLSSLTLGWLWLGFIAVVFTYLGRKNLKETLFVFATFFCLGVVFGAYLEPPSDPLEHLRRVYSYCSLSSYDIPEENRGLWHYSMSGVFLCNPFFTITPRSTLFTIDLIHGLSQGLLVTALFFVGKRAGLQSHWSFFAALTGFLFFGTNSFSYFSYYSLAASTSSMMVYWIWVSAFFFTRGKRYILTGSLFALSSLPVLLVNHKQEAAFLVLIFGLWLFLNGHEWLWRKLQHLKEKGVPPLFWKMVYISSLFLFAFVLPRFLDFDDIIQVFEYNWRTNQYLLQSILPYYQVGNFIDYRVSDSLGLMGYLPVFLAIPLLWSKSSPFSLSQRFRIVLLSCLPLVVFFIPLLSFFWVSSVHAATATSVYWRIVYSSFFWLALAAILFSIESKLPALINRFEVLKFLSRGADISRETWNKRVSRWWFVLCLLILILLSTVRSSPIYGKLDFILADSRSWWAEWQPMIERVAKMDKPVYTDDVTSIVLYDVFNFDSAHTDIKNKSYRPMGAEDGQLDIEEMINQDKYECLINLRGFKETWIPIETLHWQHTLAHTARHYQYDGLLGKKLLESPKIKQLDKCFIYQ